MTRCVVFLAVLSLIIVYAHCKDTGYSSFRITGEEPASRKEGSHRMKVRCFSCNQPLQCSSGVCYGDVCVKSAVLPDDQFVSKGCDNVTRGNQELLSQKSHCKTEHVMGLPTKICYCSDGDYCNGGNSNSVFFLISSIVSFILLPRLL